MPHLIIEHSANVADVVDVGDVVTALHAAALATGIAPLDALRTRAVERADYAIADQHHDNAFVAVIIRIGTGRTVEQKRRLIESLMAALDEVLGSAQETMMLSVECQEIDAAFRINKNNLRPVIAERADAQRSE